MNRQKFPARWLTHVGLFVGLALLAVALLVGSVAVSSAAAQTRAAPPAAPAQPGGAPEIAPASSAPGDPAAAVRYAWQRASDLGVYHFATRLVETSYPGGSPSHIDSRANEHEVRLEGEAELPARELTMRLWTGSDDTAGAAELLLDGDKAYARRSGGAWQAVEDIGGSFAPDSDLLSYLAGIKNVARLGTETRSLPAGGGVTFTRYTFDMDGPALAKYMR